MNTVQHIELIKEPQATRAINPRKFIVWLFIVSIVMLFASLTSAYIVRQSDGNWLKFKLPDIFRLTSGIIILSSLTMQLAFRAARKDDLVRLKIFLSITMLLGLLFLAGQYYSWVQLVSQNVYFAGNPAGSFIYVFTGLHAIHLISGLIFLLIMLIGSFSYKVHSRNIVSMEMCATYWHFLGGLWIYLFIFLNMYN